MFDQAATIGNDYEIGLTAFGLPSSIRGGRKVCGRIALAALAGFGEFFESLLAELELRCLNQVLQLLPGCGADNRCCDAGTDGGARPAQPEWSWNEFPVPRHRGSRVYENHARSDISLRSSVKLDIEHEPSPGLTHQIPASKMTRIRQLPMDGQDGALATSW